MQGCLCKASRLASCVTLHPWQGIPVFHTIQGFKMWFTALKRRLMTLLQAIIKRLQPHYAQSTHLWKVSVSRYSGNRQILVGHRPQIQQKRKNAVKVISKFLGSQCQRLHSFILAVWSYFTFWLCDKEERETFEILCFAGVAHKNSGIVIRTVTIYGTLNSKPRKT